MNNRARRTFIHNAVRDNSYSELSRLLINEELAYSAFYKAVVFQKPELVKLAIKKGVRLDIRNDEIKNIFKIALKNANDIIVKIFLDNGFNINDYTDNFIYYLLKNNEKMSENEVFNIFKMLVNSDTRFSDIIMHNEDMLSDILIMNKSLDLKKFVKYIINKGINFDNQNDILFTDAVGGNYLDLLMKYPFKIYESYIENVLKYSTQTQLVNNLRMILDKYENVLSKRLLNNSISDGKIEAVKILLEYFPLVDVQTVNLAISKGYTNIVKEILKKEPTLNKMSLHFAFKFPSLLKLILEYQPFEETLIRKEIDNRFGTTIPNSYSFLKKYVDAGLYEPQTVRPKKYKQPVSNSTRKTLIVEKSIKPKTKSAPPCLPPCLPASPVKSKTPLLRKSVRRHSN